MEEKQKLKDLEENKMCLYTKMILNPKYLPSKKNGGKPPQCTDVRTKYIPVACGHCTECRKKKRREWQIRMSEEIRTEKAHFLTLTISDKAFEAFKSTMEIDNIKEYENMIAGRALRLFLERVRKDTGKSLKHWCVTELGEEKGRLHLHGIFFGKNADVLCIKHWKYGFTFVGDYVNEKTINYITKYITKTDEKHRDFFGKIFTSAGLGCSYIHRSDSKRNRFRGIYTNERYHFRNGQISLLPTYLRNKIYSEDEREKLWIFKQERGVLWICGEKHNARDLEECENTYRYYQKYYQQMNGDNPREWEYQKAIRNQIRYKEIDQRRIYTVGNIPALRVQDEKGVYWWVIEDTGECFRERKTPRVKFKSQKDLPRGCDIL